VLEFFFVIVEKIKTNINMGYISEEGYNKLVAQLKHLEAVERPKVIEAIREARDKGDLSENAEYDAAKEQQGMLEAKINQLKQIIADSKILDTKMLKADTVQILTKVKLKNVKANQQMTYTIVSDTEANLREGKISVNTPIAQGLLGKKVGDVVDIKVPRGVMTFEIMEISL
jgi:transcription elongation factor GreA